MESHLLLKDLPVLPGKPAREGGSCQPWKGRALVQLSFPARVTASVLSQVFPNESFVSYQVLCKQKKCNHSDKRMGFRNFLNAVLALFFFFFLALIFPLCSGSQATSGVSVGPLSYGRVSVPCSLRCAVPGGEKTDSIGELWLVFVRFYLIR